MNCEPLTRLLFIGLWNFCDDRGRHPFSEKTLKALIFPMDDKITAVDVRRMIGELSSNELVAIYQIENKEYITVTGWKHQKIDRPQPAKYPGPDEVRRAFDEYSSNGIDGRDRKGGDRIGEEGSAEEESKGRLIKFLGRPS